MHILKYALEVPYFRVFVYDHTWLYDFLINNNFECTCTVFN